MGMIPRKHKIGVFAYDFPHWKTLEGLLWMCSEGLDPQLILAAPWQHLKLKRSNLRVVPYESGYLHPKHVAKRLEIPYRKVVHNSDECIDLIQEHKLDYGVILGARILKQGVIDAFKYGIINIHPGMIPDNRGLDNIKWAILENMPQGITIHWIDAEVDRGWTITQRKLPLQEFIKMKKPTDFTLLDFHSSTRIVELRLLMPVLHALESGSQPPDLRWQRNPQGAGVRKTVPDDLDATIPDLLPSYLENYEEIYNGFPQFCPYVF